MADSDNYAIPTRIRMEMLINEQNGLNLRYGYDFEFGIPRPSYGRGLRYNTSLVLTFKNEHEGHRERVLYRRLSLNHVRRHIPIPVFKIAEDTITTRQLLPLLNEHYGTGLEIEDLVEQTFDVISDTSYECVVANTSLAWNDGSLPFKVSKDLPLLSSVLPITQLDGLYPPFSIPVRRPALVVLDL